MCIDWLRFDNGDWDWQFHVVHRSISPAGIYRNYDLVRFVDGVPRNVAYTQAELYDALIEGISEENLPYNRASLQDCFDNESNMLALTSNEEWFWFGEMMEATIDELKQDGRRPPLPWSYDYEHEVRKDISKKHCNGLLYHSLEPLIQFIYDCLHFLLRYAIVIMLSFMILMWCLWRWSLENVLAVCECFGMLDFVSCLCA